MKTGNRGNALLVELLIVVMFFMLASSILIQVFAAAHNQSSRAELLTRAVSQAQNVADTLYTAGDPAAVLGSLGFEQKEDRWDLESEGFRIEVTIKDEPRESGTFSRREVRVLTDQETLVTLPCSRWEGGKE